MVKKNNSSSSSPPPPSSSSTKKSQSKKNEDDSSGGPIYYFLRYIVGPIFIMVACPITVNLVWYTLHHLNGSLIELFQLLISRNPLTTLQEILPVPTLKAVQMFLSFVVFELVLMIVLPGSEFKGPTSPAGFVPKYKTNGVLAFLITHALFIFGAFQMNWWSPSIIYDNLGELLSVSNASALFFSFILYFKGLLFPSNKGSDRVITKNPLIDFYWGVELYPTFFNINMKRFVNCRLGMMGWMLIALGLLTHQYHTEGFVYNSMWVSVGIQFLYIGKFFIWENGYMCTTDIMHDHLGFYLAWGTMVWMPWVHTCQTLYLINHKNNLPPIVAWGLLIMGFIGTYVNWDCDEQRTYVRNNQGNCTIWGKKPKLVVAKYKTDDGKEKTSLLLASGYWGLSRCFHYVPDMITTLCATLPAGFNHALPYFHWFYLTTLFLDRVGRQEQRCEQKYGKYWKDYCKAVPYKLIPYLY